jgi:retron-type reverse transcriptase
LLEQIVNPENMNRAYKRVKRNKGAGRIDGMGVDELLQYLKDNGGKNRETILAGKYRPAPVRRVEIPKENGKKRKLGIPTGKRTKIVIPPSILQTDFGPTWPEVTGLGAAGHSAF